MHTYISTQELHVCLCVRLCVCSCLEIWDGEGEVDLIVNYVYFNSYFWSSCQQQQFGTVLRLDYFWQLGKLSTREYWAFVVTSICLTAVQKMNVSFSPASILSKTFQTLHDDNLNWALSLSYNVPVSMTLTLSRSQGCQKGKNWKLYFLTCLKIWLSSTLHALIRSWIGFHEFGHVFTQNKWHISNVQTKQIDWFSLGDMTFAVDWALNNNYLSLGDHRREMFEPLHDDNSIELHCDFHTIFDDLDPVLKVTEFF